MGLQKAACVLQPVAQVDAAANNACAIGGEIFNLLEALDIDLQTALGEVGAYARSDFTCCSVLACRGDKDSHFTSLLSRTARLS